MHDTTRTNTGTRSELVVTDNYTVLAQVFMNNRNAIAK